MVISCWNYHIKYIVDIIMIGNGFDIAHRLPTKYEDFLEWIVAQVEFFEFLQLQGAEITKNISMHLAVPESRKDKMKISNRVEQQEELWKCISDNVWIGYFLQCEMYERENWVDFEKEISEVIQSIDTDMQKAGFSEKRIVDRISVTYFADYFLDNLDLINEIWNEEMNQALEIEKNKKGHWSIGDEADFVKKYEKDYPKALKKEKLTYKQLISRLEEDLTKLIRALEIYLTTYVAKLECNYISPDIKEIVENSNRQVKVISFNYSNTYEKLYWGLNPSTAPYCIDYLHGKAEISNSAKTNNMVLGIDEYLENDRKNKDVEFIAFKKFYQRILKGTGCRYKEWLKVIRNKSNGYSEHHIYIFGHSLDVTDKDVIRELVLNDNVRTTIFYLNKRVLGQQIANLVKVIGQDELIERVDRNTRMIEFKPQRDMILPEKNETF